MAEVNRITITAARKVQFERKGSMRDVACPNDNTKSCTSDCLCFIEPVSEGGMTAVSFRCGIGAYFLIPGANFTDSR
jgi:hypothetical protein